MGKGAPVPREERRDLDYRATGTIALAASWSESIALKPSVPSSLRRLRMTGRRRSASTNKTFFSN